jgi:hypothetical protein
MPFINVGIRKDGGPVTVKLEAREFPQSVVGILWRYAADKTPEGKAGEMTSQIQTVPLGSPASNSGKLYLLEGAVLNQNDNPPTPYQVVVAIRQNDVVVHEEVPEDGSGQIGKADVPFVYRFTLVAT